MLGKYLYGDPNSYIQIAGTNHTYFDLGTTKWKELEELVNENADEMWKINKKFIDEQKELGKEFYLSHDPNPIPNEKDSFFTEKLNILLNQLVKEGLEEELIILMKIKIYGKQYGKNCNLQ